MLAQRLRHSILLQTQSSSVDAYGGNTGTWSTAITTRAAIEPIGGTESAKNGQNVADANIRVVIRYQSGVTAQMRVVWGTRIFEILAVAVREESNRMIEITCREGRSES